MKLEARAKINWTLDITGQRSDGYHLMDMLMQPVTLCDYITLEPSEEVILTCSGEPYIAPDEHHLALKAARLMKEFSGSDRGVRIHVEKHVPVGAGMGGGSGDAAAVLWGLNRLWDLNYPQELLEQLGLKLGADVPFCLRGGLSRTTGIGEKMEKLPYAGTWPLCVIQPCEGLSTREIFGLYHARADIKRPDQEKACASLLAGHPESLQDVGGNVLYSVSAEEKPQISEAIRVLQACGAMYAMMTGSGSAVFGVFRTMDEINQIYEKLKEKWEKCYICRTCFDSIVEIK